MLSGNPIFAREFMATARSWKTRILVSLYMTALTVLLLLLWPSGGVQSVVTESSREIFSLFFNVNLALLLLIVPAFSASSITVERESSTYSALFTTLLSPFDIMIGKLSASIMMIIILSLLAMPISSVCAMTGGVDIPFMIKMMTVIIFSAVSYGLLGLACSSVCLRTGTAIMLNYVLIMMLAGATWLPAALLSNLLPELNPIWQAVRSISPFDTIMYLLYPDAYKMTVSVEFASSVFTPFNIFVVSSLVISGLSLLIFYKKVLSPSSKNVSRKGQVYTETSKAIKRKLTFPFYLFDPLKRKKPIGRFSNPVYVAEMRSKLFSNPQFVIRAVSVIFIISMGLLTLISFQFGVGLKADTVRMVSIIFQVGVVALLAPAVSSGLITDEITGGTFNQLRMTPLTPVTVIAGKLKATFFYALIFIISSVFVLLAMAYLEPQEIFPDSTTVLDPAWWSDLSQRIQSDKEWFTKFKDTYWRLFVWVIILLLSTMTFLTGGLFASCLARTTAVATAIAYSFTAVICIVTMIPIPLEDKLSRGASTFLLSFNPIASAMQVTSDAFANYPGLWLNNIYAMAGLTVFFLAGSVFRVWQLFRKSI